MIFFFVERLSMTQCKYDLVENCVNNMKNISENPKAKGSKYQIMGLTELI